MQTIVLAYDKEMYGHSVASRSYAEALTREGFSVELMPVTKEEWKAVPLDSCAQAELVIQCFIPPLLHPLSGCRNMAIVFHEWDRMPQPWIKLIDAFDAVIVSSRYLESVLQESGASVPLHYVPIPLELDGSYGKTDWQANQPFQFLSVGEWHFRKGFHLMFEAFSRAFPDGKDAELIIKTTPDIEYETTRLGVKIISDRLSDEDLKQLYLHADTYISCTLAEGFGLPLAEAMAANLPVLAPTWSGLTEFCGDGRSFEIPYKVTPQPFCSNPDFFAPDQHCALVEIDGLASQMKNIVNYSSEKRKETAKAARKHIEENFNFDKIGNILKKVILS